MPSGRQHPLEAMRFQPASRKGRDSFREKAPEGIGGRLKGVGAWLRGDDLEAPPIDEEETEGLLGVAGRSMKNLAEAGMGKLGGNMGAAVQVAKIGTQRWTVFFILIGIGTVLMALSFMSLPMIVLAPTKFATGFTTGSLCILASLAVLKGVPTFVSHLTSRERLPLSVGYFASIGGTLWACFSAQSSLLALVFCVSQVCALTWFLVSYLPGGNYVLGVVRDFFCGCCMHMCRGPKNVGI